MHPRNLHTLARLLAVGLAAGLLTSCATSAHRDAYSEHVSHIVQAVKRTSGNQADLKRPSAGSEFVVETSQGH